jgi:hypothetical protein
MDLTTATPVEIDTKLAEISEEVRSAQVIATAAWNSVVRAATKYVGKEGKFERVGRKTVAMRATDEEIQTALVEAAEFEGQDICAMETAEQRVKAWNGLDLVEAQVRFEEAADKVAAIKVTALPYDAEFTRRGGWSRFFLVTSSDGHIHSSMNCSTCNPRTTYAWYPEFSGQTMAEAIAAWDERGSAEVLCTTCFPDAPTPRTQKPVEDGVCPGSGTWDYPAETARKGYAAGNYGVCRHCGTAITISSTGKMRKHKTPKAA